MRDEGAWLTAPVARCWKPLAGPSALGIARRLGTAQTTSRACSAVLDASIMTSELPSVKAALHQKPFRNPGPYALLVSGY